MDHALTIVTTLPDVFDLEFQALMLREIKLKVVSEQLEETGKTAREQKLVLTQTREKVAAEDRAYQQKLLTFSQEFGSFSHDKLTNIHAAKESQVEARCSSALFVFSINDLKQNARSLLTPVSDTAFYALSHGNLYFVLHGSSNNRLFQRF